MRIIKRTMLMDFAKRHGDAEPSLSHWIQITRHVRWTNLNEVRIEFPHADLVKVASGNTVTVFNVAGSKYRLVTAIHYNRQVVYTLRIMTHAEYSRAKWKEQL